MGIPVKLGKKGVEEIYEIELNHDELSALRQSAEHVRESISKLKI
ncbi:MAG: hypothetical protein ACE5JB_06220 [bacterium]